MEKMSIEEQIGRFMAGVESISMVTYFIQQDKAICTKKFAEMIIDTYKTFKNVINIEELSDNHKGVIKSADITILRELSISMNGDITSIEQIKNSMNGDAFESQYTSIQAKFIQTLIDKGQFLRLKPEFKTSSQLPYITATDILEKHEPELDLWFANLNLESIKILANEIGDDSLIGSTIGRMGAKMFLGNAVTHHNDMQIRNMDYTEIFMGLYNVSVEHYRIECKIRDKEFTLKGFQEMNYELIETCLKQLNDPSRTDLDHLNESLLTYFYIYELALEKSEYNNVFYCEDVINEVYDRIYGNMRPRTAVTEVVKLVEKRKANLSMDKYIQELSDSIDEELRVATIKADAYKILLSVSTDGDTIDIADKLIDMYRDLGNTYYTDINLLNITTWSILVDINMMYRELEELVSAKIGHIKPYEFSLDSTVKHILTDIAENDEFINATSSNLKIANMNILIILLLTYSKILFTKGIDLLPEDYSFEDIIKYLTDMKSTSSYNDVIDDTLLLIQKIRDYR